MDAPIDQPWSPEAYLMAAILDELRELRASRVIGDKPVERVKRPPFKDTKVFGGTPMSLEEADAFLEGGRKSDCVLASPKQ